MTEKETTPEQATRVIKGSIEYTITLFDGETWEVEYQQGIENEIAALSIAQHVMEASIVTASLQKKESKGKIRKSLSEQIEKFSQARFGLNMLSTILCDSYDSFMEQKAKHEKDMLTAEVSKKDQELLKGMMDGNK